MTRKLQVLRALTYVMPVIHVVGSFAMWFAFIEPVFSAREAQDSQQVHAIVHDFARCAPWLAGYALVANVLVGTYLFLAWTNRKLSLSGKLRWSLALTLFNLFAMPVYFRRHVRPEAKLKARAS